MYARDPSLVEYSPVINTLPTSNRLLVYNLYRDLQAWMRRDHRFFLLSFNSSLYVVDN